MLFAMCFRSAGEVGGTRLLKNVFFCSSHEDGKLAHRCQGVTCDTKNQG